MEILVYNFHSVLTNSLICKRTPSAKLRLRQVRFVSPPNVRTSSFSTFLGRMAQVPQNPGSKICPSAALPASLKSFSDANLTWPQKVVVSNKHGENLVGLLHETGSVEIVILCHGFRSAKDNNVMVNLAVALENEGISAFRFDFAGNGESEGSFEYGNYRREADDLRSVVQHFTGANRVIGGILGHSKGGNVVLVYASEYHDVHTVVNVSGRYDMKRGISERLGEDFMRRIKEEGFIDVKNKDGSVNYRVTLESLTERLRTDMHNACLHIDKDCRILTVHGSADEIIPVEDAYEFAKIIPNHKLHIIEGADHGYSNHQAELATAVLEFIKSCLQQEKTASS